MKKILFVFLLFISFSNYATASQVVHSSVYLMDKQNDIPQNIKIVKNKSGYYGVVDKITKKELIPCKYGKIKKLSNDTVKVKTDKSDKQEWKILTNNNLPVMNTAFEKIAVFPIDEKKPKTIDNLIFIGIYSDERIAQISIPSHSSKDFFKKIFEQNNKYSWIKFHNYPVDNAVLVFKHDNYFGYITTKDDDYFMVLPLYSDIFVPDGNTSIYKQFGISYSDIENIKIGNYYNTLNLSGNLHEFTKGSLDAVIEPYIDEAVEVKNEELHFTFKNIVFPYKDLFYSESRDGMLLNSKGDKLSSSNKRTQKCSDIQPIQSFCDRCNKENFLKFSNYPQSKIYIKSDVSTSNYAYIFDKNGDKFEIRNVRRLNFPDSNTLIYKFLGVSYSNSERILTQAYNDKWGIIDRNGNVIVDYQYDSAVTLSAKDKSEVKYDGKNVYIIYKGIEIPYEDLVMVTKDGLSGVINKDGNILIPLKKRYDKNAMLNDLSNNKNLGFSDGLYLYDKMVKEEFKTEKIKETPYYFINELHFWGITMPAMLVTSPIWPVWFLDNAVCRFLFNAPLIPTQYGR